jgi:cell division protein FtsZ
MGILTVGVVTKPFHFESGRRMKVAEVGIAEMKRAVDTLIIIPNQNLFRIAKETTIVKDAFAMVDQVRCSGVACITDLMVKEGLVNLDFADVCSIVSEMGTAMIGAGEASGERRALRAAEAAMANPLLQDSSIKSARGVLISITGGEALTLFEVDEAGSSLREHLRDDRRDRARDLLASISERQRPPGEVAVHPFQRIGCDNGNEPVSIW